MRTLQIHAREFWYKVTKKAIKNPEELQQDRKEIKKENVLVVFVSVEEDDDTSVLIEAANSITQHAETVKVKEIILYPYAHLSSRLAPPTKAMEVLKKLDETIKDKGYITHRAPFGWYKEFLLKATGHPLSELSREFRPEKFHEPNIIIDEETRKLLEKEYLKRFGIILKNNSLEISQPWSNTVFELLSLIHKKSLSKIELKEQSECPEIILEKQEVFPKITIPEIAIKIDSLTNIEKNMVCNGKIVVEKNEILLYKDNLKARIGKILCNKPYIYTNTLLLSMLAGELEKINKNEIPMIPFILSPIQVYVAIGGKVSRKYIEKLIETLEKLSVRYVVDDRDVRLGEKLRKSGMMWSPITIIVGAREEETNTVVVRKRITKVQSQIKLEDLSQIIEEEKTHTHCK